jgi:L-Ala-D/L-Glu epimerase
MIELTVRQETWPVRGVFRISRGSRTEVNVVVVELRQEGQVGRGESVPYSRYQEKVPEVVELVRSLAPAVAAGLTRAELQEVLAPGAARNALDCALWDLEAKRCGQPAWQLAGVDQPRPAVTAVTISVDTPEKMAEAAAKHSSAPLLKVKLGGEGDLERMRAVREAAPTSRLIVDANEAWTAQMCREWIPVMAGLGVELIEQPLPAGEDHLLRDLSRAVPICADESCHTRADLSRLQGLYDYVNIKLDKTGGLTEALLLARAAREARFGIMVGCMLGTSLAMAPATLLTSVAGFVDLDGPLLLDRDRESGLDYTGGEVHPPLPELWG